MFDNYDDAVDHRLRVVERARRGLGGDPSAARTAFGDWWMQWRAGVTRRPNTLARYDSLWREHLGPKWARLQLGRLTRVEAQQWVQELVQAGQSPASVRKAVFAMATCVETAVKDDIIPRNPFRGLDSTAAAESRREDRASGAWRKQTVTQTAPARILRQEPKGWQDVVCRCLSVNAIVSVQMRS
jgi:hypothetical protein